MAALGKDKTAIAERLKEARKSAGLSQSQVAQMIGIHRPTVSEIEAGRRNVSTEELTKLAEIYSVNIEWVATGGLVSDSAPFLMAARELSNMSDADLDKLMRTIKMIKGAGRD